MKTTFEDFEKTTLYENLVTTFDDIDIKAGPRMQSERKASFHLAIKTAFLVGHQLGLDEARAILNGEKKWATTNLSPMKN